MCYGRGIRVVCLFGNIGIKTQEAPMEDISLVGYKLVKMEDSANGNR